MPKLSTPGMIEWLSTQPPQGTFNFWDTENCAMMQYAKSQGVSERYWALGREWKGGLEAYDRAGNALASSAQITTFRAAHDALKAITRSTSKQQESR